MVKGRKRLARPAPAPPLSRSSDLYIHIKRRLGCTFRRLYPKGWLVYSRKQVAYQLPGIKGSLVGPQGFQPLCRGRVVLVATDNTTVVAYINKEGGMRSGSLCALLWRLLSWCNLRKICLRARHIPGRLNVIADKLPGHSDGMVPASGGLCSDLSQVAPSPSELVRNQVQQYPDSPQGLWG